MFLLPGGKSQGSVRMPTLQKMQKNGQQLPYAVKAPRIDASRGLVTPLLFDSAMLGATSQPRFAQTSSGWASVT